MRLWYYIVFVFGSVVTFLLYKPHYIYFYNLPTSEEIAQAETLDVAFKNWSIPEKIYMSRTDQFPPDVFKCSDCYPEEFNSTYCKDKLAHWIAFNLGTNQPQNKSVLAAIRDRFLALAIIYKYDSDTFDRIYYAFVARSSYASNIETACQEKFKKECSKLSYEEAIDLQIAVRMYHNGPSEEGLKETIRKFCAK